MIAIYMMRVLQGLRRPMNWVHSPTQREREDEAYLEPMKLLEKMDDSTDVFVGVVHANDSEGAMRRMETATKVFEGRALGTPTECGIAWKSEAQFESTLERLCERCLERKAGGCSRQG